MNTESRAQMIEKYWCAVFKLKIWGLVLKDKREGHTPPSLCDLFSVKSENLGDYHKEIAIKSFIEVIAKEEKIDLSQIREFAEQCAAFKYVNTKTRGTT